jgi:outer membrane receptor protein involved in Fe transport
MVRDSVSISDLAKTIAFGNIKMKTAKGNILNEVTVTAPKTTMQLGIDKKVFSVDQSIVSEGGSATDLLQNVPSVQTDSDGNVSLRGSSGVRVLIDGKPSLIGGGNVAQILQSIPASSIESVELITNPSAKYDAEGQSGIINIVLKKNKKLGFNGSLALTAGNRENYNANTSLSFQNSKINLFGKAIRKSASKLRSGIDIFYMSEIEFIQGKSRKTLTDTIAIKKFSNIINNLNKFQVANRLGDILDDFIKGEEKDKSIFALIDEVFSELNNINLKVEKHSLLYYYFLWNVLALLGYQPEVNRCNICYGKFNQGDMYFSNISFI